MGFSAFLKMHRKKAPPKVAESSFQKKGSCIRENTVEQNTLAGLEAPNHVGATAKLAAGSGGMRRVAKEYTDDVDGDEDLRIVDDDVGTGRQGRNLFTLGYGREQRPNICF